MHIAHAGFELGPPWPLPGDCGEPQLSREKKVKKRADTMANGKINFPKKKQKLARKDRLLYSVHEKV